jgi:eight-cysteine-cluster-containing protein
MLMLLACTCASEVPTVALEPSPVPDEAQGRAQPMLPPGLEPLTEITIRNGAELYAQCRDRVELPEASGECATDADCERAGCSGESCVAKGADRMTTCEIRLCFHVLESCGCVDGVCQWARHEEGAVVPAWTFTGQPGLQPVER